MQEGNLLENVWVDQGIYNAAVRQRQERSDAEWMETYILGLMSELGQLLDSMRWKRHKLESIEQFSPNVPQELADITKYVFSMWQLMGFSAEQMLEEVDLKSRFLQQMFSQDFCYTLQKKAVIFDLDDVLADLQGGLQAYLQDRFSEHEKRKLEETSIHLDVANGWNFDEYREAKNEFEICGGYRNLEPLYAIGWLFSSLRRMDISIIVWTARPVKTFRRIALDTFMWFEELGVQPDILRFGREERISYACELARQGIQIALVEDNAELARRAWQSAIPTIVPRRSYNAGAANFNGTVEDLLSEITQRLEPFSGKL